jgi:hypothetical protein
LILEIGYGQRDGIMSLVKKENVYEGIEVKKDLGADLLRRQGSAEESMR